MLAVQLNANPSSEDVKRAIAIIGHWAGPVVMSSVAAELGLAARAAEPAFVPPPPPPTDTAIIPPPPAVRTLELDAEGLPWDERIHSSSKDKNKSGSWKVKRGMSDSPTFATVVAELRQTFPAPAGAPAAPAPVPPPPAADAAPPPPPPPPGGMDFPGLMRRVSKLIASKKLTAADLNVMAQMIGLNASHELAQHPDKIESFNSQITAHVGSAE